MNAKARQRAELIFKVRSGQMTATEAAQALGISRQQYYQWEQRALQALLSALEDQPTGRPKTPTDPEKEALQRRVQQLEQQVQRTGTAGTVAPAPEPMGRAGGPAAR